MTPASVTPDAMPPDAMTAHAMIPARADRPASPERQR